MNIRRYRGTKIVLRGVIKMSVLAKGKPIMFSIKQERAKDFIEECNKNVITKSFIDECKQASKLFRKK